MKTGAFNWLINRAYIRDGNNLHTGEALIIACLLHSVGRDRSGQDMEVVRKIMRDHNAI
jgi:hypothetical protein